MPKVKTLRVHTLAKELGVSSKDVIEKCRAEGIELKNHMAAISVGLAESIREWFSVGEDVTSVEVAEKVDLTTVRKTARKRAKTPEPEPETGAPGEAVPQVVPAEVMQEVSAPAAGMEPVATEPAPAPEAPPTVIPRLPQEEQAPAAAELGGEPAEAQPLEIAARAPEPPTPPPPEAPPPEPIKPAGPQLVPKPAALQGPRLIRMERPEPIRTPRPRPSAPTREVASEPPRVTTPVAGRKARRPEEVGEEREAARARSRSPRRHGRHSDVGERLKEWRDQDLIERKERLAGATGHGLKERRAAERRRQAAATVAPGRKGPVELKAPIGLKDLCAAIGISFAEISKKLLEHTGKLWTINQSLDAETLELLALDLGVALTVQQERSALDRLREEYEQRERTHAMPRPPVVAMLGHVDHGKTSLLDAIRKANVAAGEAGGITQHIGAYRVDRDGWRVTFLDTPGHEAFTALRARGANLTDVVVLVVAADDGVMPQTVEAINHARAAGVQIVVALNKIDLPNVDINRIYAQLAEHGLVPAEWGGETDVIKTSATTGQGIQDLIAHLSTLSELLDLKADPTVPAYGTVIEAHMREGQGVVAQVLVREGTLRLGRAIVCGPGAGRVRRLCDDRGQSIKEAGPGWPVEVIGIDELPQAGDALYEVADLKQAKELAQEVRQLRRSASLEALRKPRTLEEVLAGDGAKVPELNLILKADVQGSVEVLKQALGDLPSDKAQLRILHAAVGAVSEADVNLARASNATVVGFHVVAEERARQLAEELDVEIRLYRVIYDVLEDMRKALAGLLEPVRREEVRGRAEVRQIFNITRVGTVAGCRVVDGTVMRNHRARLVRDGRIVLADAAIQSLRHHKDDVREARAGGECGLKIEGFDDVKPGDVIETYEIVESAAELE